MVTVCSTDIGIAMMLGYMYMYLGTVWGEFVRAFVQSAQVSGESWAPPFPPPIFES